MKALPKLPFIVVIVIFSILFSSHCSCLFFVESLLYTQQNIYQTTPVKLPFQWVVIHLKPSPNEGVMSVSLLALRAVQKILECTTFNVLDIPACRNLRLTWFLIHWNGNFVELLNIQKYAAICFWGRAGHGWEQYLLMNSSEDVNDLDHVVFGA